MLLHYQAEAKGLRAAATFECAESPEGKEAIILAPGLSSPELTGLRKELVGLGHVAISFEQPRAGYMRLFGDVGELRPRILESVTDEARAKLGVERFVLAGHSLGGIDVTRMAKMADDSETFSSLELVASAGFTGESFLRIAQRLGHVGVGELIKGKGGMVSRSVLNALRNPIQLLAEGHYGQNSSIADDVTRLAEEIDVGIMQFENDAVFPVERVLASEKARRLIESGVVRSVITGLPIHACHTAPICDPAGTAKVLHDTLARRVPTADPQAA